MDDTRPDASLSADTYGDSVDSVEYDPDTGVYRVSADLAHPEPFAYVVVDAVATVTAREVESLPPLQNAVDADALDELLRSTPDVQVSFRYAGCEVTVTGRGEVSIRTP